MKFATIWAFALNLAIGAASCAHTPPTVTAFGHCVTDALREAGNSVLGRVMTALATGDYVGELAKLGALFGGDVVGCAVDLAISQLTGMHAASPDPIVATMLERAQAFRGANP
jgi:hypothetical protein